VEAEALRVPVLNHRKDPDPALHGGENADAEAQENLVGYFFAGYILELCRRNAR
jgi:hypothetical protein